MNKTIYNYSKLRGKLRELDISNDKLAQHLSISEQSLYNKLNSKTYFKQNEIENIMSYLGESMSVVSKYFFTTKVAKIKQI